MDQHGLTRRGVLGKGAGVAAGAFATAGILGLPAQSQAAGQPDFCTSALPPGLTTAAAGGRVDVHTHHIPPVYRQALLAAGQATIGGYPTPAWTPSRHISFMDDYGIQLGALSLSDPGVSFLSGTAAATLARQVNEYTAGLIQQYPTRFGGFAVLPLPDIDASLTELTYALDTLRLDGVGLLTTYSGSNIAEPQFDPLWAELNRRGTYVFMHPATLASNAKPMSPLPDFLVEFTFDTTRFMALALNTGLTTSYPNVRIQLAHAGGAFPYLAYRIAVFQNGAGNSLPVAGADSINGLLPAAQIDNIFYDTALSPAPSSMASVLKISDVDHIVFGSDWPFTELLFTIPGDPQPPLSLTFDTLQRASIERANALGELPRIASALGGVTPDKTVSVSFVSAAASSAKKPNRRVAFVLKVGEPLQVNAAVMHGTSRITSKQFSPVPQGRQTLHLPLPDGVKKGHYTLVLNVTDEFGNTVTMREKLTL